MNKAKIKKIIELCIGMPLLLISYLFIRDKRKIVVGNNIPGFTGNPKYFMIKGNSDYPDFRMIWIANKKTSANVRKLGFESYYRYSIKGLYHCLTASQYVVASTASDINHFTYGNAKIITLWHGVGIKAIGKLNPNGPYNKSYINRFLYHRGTLRKPDIVLTTSPFMTKHFSRCLDVNEENCKEACYPRCEIFGSGRQYLNSIIEKYDETNSILSVLNKIKDSSRTYIYMPTWRDSKADFVKMSGFDFEKLDNMLQNTNQFVLLKMHPATNISYDLQSCKNIILLNKNADVYPLLPFTDVLITDYSSIYYDYILQKEKQVLLFPFDIDNYLSKDRDLAYDFNENTPGKRVYSFEELYNLMLNKENLISSEVGNIRKKFWDFNTDIYKEIFDYGSKTC